MSISRLIMGLFLILAGIVLTVVAFFTSLIFLIYSIAFLVIGIVLLLNKNEDKIEERLDSIKESKTKSLNKKNSKK